MTEIRNFTARVNPDTQGSKKKEEAKKEETAPQLTPERAKVDPSEVEKFMNAQAAAMGTVVKPPSGGDTSEIKLSIVPGLTPEQIKELKDILGKLFPFLAKDDSPITQEELERLIEKYLEKGAPIDSGDLASFNEKIDTVPEVKGGKWEAIRKWLRNTGRIIVLSHNNENKPTKPSAQDMEYFAMGRKIAQGGEIPEDNNGEIPSRMILAGFIYELYRFMVHERAMA